MPFKRKPVRPIRIEDDVAYITLTQGCEATIDLEDIGLVKDYNWCAHKPRGNSSFYAVRMDYSGTKAKAVRMHCILMGSPEKIEIDHKDGNGLNNRRRGETGNLRVATRSQNMHNRGSYTSNTSGYKGVTWRKDKKRWQAQIMVKSKRKQLGRFKTKEEAYAAYCEAVKKYHGDFGRIV